MTTPDESFKSLELLLFLISFVAGWIMLTKLPRNKAHSLSIHAASQQVSSFLFGITLTVAAVLFYLFCIQWFIPTFHLSQGFTLIMTITMVLILFTGWIPHRGKIKGSIHQIVAYGFAAMLPIMLVFLLFSSEISLVAKIISGIAISYMLIGWYLLLFVKRVLKYYLPLQIAYIVSFHLAILAATYVR